MYRMIRDASGEVCRLLPAIVGLVFLEYHVLREEEDPHADTRAGIDASWLVCRGADYALRLRPTPRVAQALLSQALFL